MSPEKTAVSAPEPPSIVSLPLPPVITSIDYSPDGKLLAVAGFHEVLLHKADGSGLKARLVGLSERIESVRFSPDGTLFASCFRKNQFKIFAVENKLTTAIRAPILSFLLELQWLRPLQVW